MRDLTTNDPHIRVDNRYETLLRPVSAIGEGIGAPMLAHHAPVHRRGEATREPVMVTSTPFIANGRATTQGADSGFVRLLSRVEDAQVLGTQAIGAGVSELPTALGIALEMRANVDDIAAATIHRPPWRGF